MKGFVKFGEAGLFILISARAGSADTNPPVQIGPRTTAFGAASVPQSPPDATNFPALFGGVPYFLKPGSCAARRRA